MLATPTAAEAPRETGVVGLAHAATSLRLAPATEVGPAAARAKTDASDTEPTATVNARPIVIRVPMAGGAPRAGGERRLTGFLHVRAGGLELGGGV